MEPPSCFQDEPFPHPLEPEPGAPAQPGPGKPNDKRFRLWYVGGSCLDRRTTLPMLPWLMAEIRRRSQKPEAGGCGAPAAREVLLVLSAPFLRCVPAPGVGATGGSGPTAAQPNPAVFIFEHKAQHISRFIHNSQDLSYFAYLIKAQPDDPESQMACHVFRAADPNQARPRGSEAPGRVRHTRGEWRGSGRRYPPLRTGSGPAAGARPPRGALERSWSRSSDPESGSWLLGADGAAGAGDPQERGREREAEWLRDGGGARTMRGAAHVLAGSRRLGA